MFPSGRCPGSSPAPERLGSTLHLEIGRAEQELTVHVNALTRRLFLDLFFRAKKPQSFEARISPRWEEENI